MRDRPAEPRRPRRRCARRLEHPRRALANSADANIGEIATACGFKSNAHFCRACSARFGCARRLHAGSRRMPGGR
ncbi:MAG: helix-turn-helix domain-containing protein [Gammaproteobacteria bacterium]